MKTRTGFVSNSSSSSFVIGIGRVVSEKKLRGVLAENGVDIVNNHSANILTVDEIKSNHYYIAKTTGNTITVDSFQDSITFKVRNKDDKFLIVNYIGDEGDYSFEDEDGELDYGSFNSDMLPSDILTLVDALNHPSLGIDNNTSIVNIGAGRNG